MMNVLNVVAKMSYLNQVVQLAYLVAGLHVPLLNIIPTIRVKGNNKI
jgi:hypothetical protein